MFKLVNVLLIVLFPNDAVGFRLFDEAGELQDAGGADDLCNIILPPPGRLR